MDVDTDTVTTDGSDGGTDDASVGGVSPRQKRAQSTIRFSYVGLDEAVTVARTVWSKGGECSVNQLAADFDQKTTSGSFRVKISGTKMFGLITGSNEALKLTALGRRLVDDRTAAAARADAFLNVPLYKALFEYVSPHGGTLPPTSEALEKTIVQLGVVENQAETARLAFTRSAREAGYFDHGSDRLIKPSLSSLGRDDHKQDEEPDDSHDEVEDRLIGKPSIVVEIFKRLPDEGKSFGDRDAWTKLLNASLDVLYPVVSTERKVSGDERGPFDV